VLVLRPAPGDAATASRLLAAGMSAVRLPLFEIVPLAWVPPSVEQDALLLTSANAVRHAGTQLDACRHLPTIAVGHATAHAARSAGLTLVGIGDNDAVAALALAHACGWRRIVRLAGRERTPLTGVTDVAVYASEPCAVPATALSVARGAVALLHSTRAAQRFAALLDDVGISRGDVRLGAISEGVLAAAGHGWGAVAVAAVPDDAALVAVAATLAIDR
jgi:uroporphyrinogen-III synthase